MNNTNNSSSRILYNGALFCHTSNCCPVAEQMNNGNVKLYDPSKPEKGQFVFTASEWKSFTKNVNN